MSPTDTQIVLPVSLGEALDKLTILDIKLSKIQDARRADVQLEYDTLFHALKGYVEAYPYHYRILREINQTLWDIQDQFHGKDISPEQAAQIAREILLENDRRFRVKLKINTLAASTLKEQKGYQPKKALFYGHLGLGDMVWMNGAVRYLATAFDEVHVVCKERNVRNAAAMFADDPSIKLLIVKDDADLHPWPTRRFWFMENGYTVFSCGFFAQRPDRSIYDLPNSFYDDLALPRDVRTKYFHVPRLPEAAALLTDVRQLAAGRSLIVIHQQSSVEKLPIFEAVRAERPDAVILDVNENHYKAEEDQAAWAAAELVVNKPVLHYTDLFEAAEELHMIESSLYCLASHLDVSKAKRRVCYKPWGGNAERLGVFTTGSIPPNPSPQ